MCADDADEGDRLSVEDDGLPRPTRLRRSVDDARPVLLVVGHVDVVAVAATVAVPKQKPATNTQHVQMLCGYRVNTRPECVESNYAPPDTT